MAAATSRTAPPARGATPNPAPAPAPRRDFLAMLDASRGEIERLIPDPRKIDRIVRIVRSAWQMKPAIRQCEPMSILSSVMKACELGLDPDGARKHCHLIPFKGECTLQVGYLGMLELAHRSGAFRVIEARVVHRGDLFAVEYNPEPVLRHVPGPGGPDADITHVYAYARLRSGALVLEVMARDEVERVRRAARAGNVWESWWGEMAKKTAIKRLLKRQPSSVELADAIEHDNASYDDDAPEAGGRAGGYPGATRSARLAAQLAPPPEPEDESQEPPVPAEEIGQDAGRDDDEAFPLEPGSGG